MVQQVESDNILQLNDTSNNGGTEEYMPMSQQSDMEEICPVYGGRLVAYDKKTQKLVCNQFIYNEIKDHDEADERLDFTSYVASNLKDMFDEKFSLYKESMSKMTQIAPQAISRTLENTIQNFFNQIEQQISVVETQVLSKIENSKNLQELELLLTKERPSFNLDSDKTFEYARQDLETNVSRGHYATVVSDQDRFNQMITTM